MGHRNHLPGFLAKIHQHSIPAAPHVSPPALTSWLSVLRSSVAYPRVLKDTSFISLKDKRDDTSMVSALLISSSLLWGPPVPNEESVYELNEGSFTKLYPVLTYILSSFGPSSKFIAQFWQESTSRLLLGKCIAVWMHEEESRRLVVATRAQPCESQEGELLFSNQLWASVPCLTFWLVIEGFLLHPCVGQSASFNARVSFCKILPKNSACLLSSVLSEAGVYRIVP